MTATGKAFPRRKTITYPSCKLNWRGDCSTNPSSDDDGCSGKDKQKQVHSGLRKNILWDESAYLGGNDITPSDKPAASTTTQDNAQVEEVISTIALPVTTADSYYCPCKVLDDIMTICWAEVVLDSLSDWRE